MIRALLKVWSERSVESEVGAKWSGYITRCYKAHCRCRNCSLVSGREGLCWDHIRKLTLPRRSLVSVLPCWYNKTGELWAVQFRSSPCTHSGFCSCVWKPGDISSSRRSLVDGLPLVLSWLRDQHRWIQLIMGHFVSLFHICIIFYFYLRNSSRYLWVLVLDYRALHCTTYHVRLASLDNFCITQLNAHLQPRLSLRSYSYLYKQTSRTLLT